MFISTGCTDGLKDINQVYRPLFDALDFVPAPGIKTNSFNISHVLITVMMCFCVLLGHGIPAFTHRVPESPLVRQRRPPEHLSKYAAQMTPVLFLNTFSGCSHNVI